MKRYGTDFDSDRRRYPLLFLCLSSLPPFLFLGHLFSYFLLFFVFSSPFSTFYISSPFPSSLTHILSPHPFIASLFSPLIVPIFTFPSLFPSFHSLSPFLCLLPPPDPALLLLSSPPSLHSSSLLFYPQLSPFLFPSILFSPSLPLFPTSYPISPSPTPPLFF